MNMLLLAVLPNALPHDPWLMAIGIVGSGLIFLVSTYVTFK